MSMRDVLVVAMVAGAVGLAGCGGDDGGEPVLAGTYVGDLVIAFDDMSTSVFADAELVVADDGSVDGSTLTTTSPTTPAGEDGAITGELVVASGAFVDADLTVAFPTLGTYTLTGAISWIRQTEELGGSIETRSGGAVVGSTTFALSKE